MARLQNQTYSKQKDKIRYISRSFEKLAIFVYFLFLINFLNSKRCFGTWRQPPSYPIHLLYQNTVSERMRRKFQKSGNMNHSFWLEIRTRRTSPSLINSLIGYWKVHHSSITIEKINIISISFWINRCQPKNEVSFSLNNHFFSCWQTVVRLFPTCK